MSAPHIVNRFDFNLIAAGIMNLVVKPALFSKYKKFLDSDFFFYNDTSRNAKGLRKIIKVLHQMDDDGKSSDFSPSSVEGYMSYSLLESEEANAAKDIFAEMRRNPEITNKLNDSGTFKIFLDYLKVIRVAKHANLMFQEYQKGRIDETAKVMSSILGEINQIKDPEYNNVDVSKDFYEILQDKHTDVAKDILLIGNDGIDTALGGFETQTLNLFISVTNGGKSTMAHHLLKRCIEQKKRVHVTCVEDRPKSFLVKFVSCYTGIPIYRIKKEMHLLTAEEKAKLADAQKKLETYAKVDFIYGCSVDDIHKLKLEYDIECQMKGIPKPVVDIIDYTGHIAAKAQGDKMYEQMRNAYGQRKDFALANNKIAFDFAQVNREGSKRLNEDKILTQSDLAGSYDLAQVCDNIISINRSALNREENKAILHIAKARDGEAGSSWQVNTEFDRARYDMLASIQIKM